MSDLPLGVSLSEIERLFVERVQRSIDDKARGRFAEEYDWFAKQKAAALGVEVHDHGLTFKAETERQRRKESN